MNLSGVDLELADPWLPRGWTLTGQADADWRGSLSAKAATVEVSMGLGSQAALCGPDCRLSVTGTPAAAAVQAVLDRQTGSWQVQTGDMTGLGVIQADAGFVALLRRAAAPAPGGTAAFLLDRRKGGRLRRWTRFRTRGRSGPARRRGRCR